MITIGLQFSLERAGGTHSRQPATFCTIAGTRPTTSHALGCCASLAERHRQHTTQGGPVKAYDWSAVFPPRTTSRSAAPDPSLLLPQDLFYNNTRSTSTRTRQGRTLPPWNGLIIQALFLIAFLEDNDHASRTERCREGSPLRACQNLPHLNFLRTL